MVSTANEEEVQLAKKKILINLINSEISQIESEQRRPGWTSWALLGALSSLTWLLVKHASLKSLDWQNVGLIFFTLTLTIEFIRGLCMIFTLQDGHTPREPRFVSSPFYGASKLYFLALIFQGSILLFISIHLGRQIYIIPRIFSWAVSIVFILIGIVALVLSYLKRPQSIYQKQSSSIFAGIILAFLMIIVLAGYWGVLIRSVSGLDQSNLQTATLLVLILYVLILLANIPKQSPILPSLVSIRRDLSLDRIDASWAAKQLDVAFSGMQVEDLLQDYVQKILNCEASINDVLKQMMRTSEAIIKQIPSKPSDIIEEALASNREAIKAMMEANKVHATKLESLRMESGSSVKKYFEKANQIMSADDRSADAINEVTSKFGVAQAESNKMDAAVKERMALIKEKIDGSGAF